MEQQPKTITSSGSTTGLLKQLGLATPCYQPLRTQAGATAWTICLLGHFCEWFSAVFRVIFSLSTLNELVYGTLGGVT